MKGLQMPPIERSAYRLDYDTEKRTRHLQAAFAVRFLENMTRLNKDSTYRSSRLEKMRVAFFRGVLHTIQFWPVICGRGNQLVYAHWDERMGIADGEKHWRQKNRIPLSAQGQFFPLPDTLEEIQKRKDHIQIERELSNEPLATIDSNSGHFFKGGSPDRRVLTYYRQLALIILNTEVDIQEALKDAWWFRMEDADFCLSFEEYPLNVQIWRNLPFEGKLSFLKRFDTDTDRMKSWKSDMASLTINRHDQGPEHEEAVAQLRTAMVEQRDFTRFLHISIVPINTYTLPVNADVNLEGQLCPICLEDFVPKDGSEPDPDHRPVQTYCGPVLHVFGKSCIDQAWRMMGTCPMCRFAVAFRSPNDEEQFLQMQHDMRTYPPGASSIEKARRCAHAAGRYCHTSPEVQELNATGADIERFSALLLAPAMVLYHNQDESDETIVHLRASLSHHCIMGYHVASQKMKAYLEGDEGRLRSLALEQAIVRTRLICIQLMLGVINVKKGFALSRFARAKQQ